MALQDCIQEALQHNLDVQIERYNPQISSTTCIAAYGGYDPLLNISGQHNYNVSPGGLAQNLTNAIPSSTSDENSFKSDIGGVLPWGLHYDFSAIFQSNTDNTDLQPLRQLHLIVPEAQLGSASRSRWLKNFWIDIRG